MELNFTLERKDLLIFYKRTLRKESFLFMPYVFLLAAFVIFILKAPRNSFLPDFNVHYFIEFGLTYGLVFVLILIIRDLTINRYKKEIRLNPSSIGHRKIELTENSLIVTNNISISEMKIEALTKIEAIPNYYYLYIENRVSIIIPKSAEGTEEFIRNLERILKINVC